MGNRCVITTKEHKIGVYLHWNGGPNDVASFLHYCKLAKYRTPETDCYGWARLCQVIGNYFDDGLSIGINMISRLDCNNYDNGTYIIKDWCIIAREYTSSVDYGVVDKMMLVDIDKAQPVRILDDFGNLLEGKEPDNDDKFHCPEV